MKDGRCKRGYDAMPILQRSMLNDLGFPNYKRLFDHDLNIVPHNRGMMMDWDAHFNVEYCGSTYAVLYLYKYLFKGSHKLKVTFNARGAPDPLHPRDEIGHYIRGRKLSSMECMW